MSDLVLDRVKELMTRLTPLEKAECHSINFRTMPIAVQSLFSLLGDVNNERAFPSRIPDNFHNPLWVFVTIKHWKQTILDNIFKTR